MVVTPPNYQLLLQSGNGALLGGLRALCCSWMQRSAALCGGPPFLHAFCALEQMLFVSPPDAHAASLDITSSMLAAHFVSSAACSDVALLHWQAVLPWIITVRLLEAPLRLPTWLNDDLRPVPRLQLCWASEFNSPVGLLQWRSCTSYEGVLPRSRTMADPAVVHGLPVLDGSRF